MYLYFDSTGTLKEIVNDSKVRQGSDNVNKLYFYFEDASAYSAIALTIKYPDGTTSTPYVITSNVAQVTFPESLNKLSYFVEGKNYSMYYYTLSSTDLAQSGMCSATVVAYTGGSANAYGLFTFKVEQSVLAENITLTQTDLTYILEQIANIAGDISVYVSNAEPTSIVSKLGRSQDSQSPTTLGENSVELGKNAEASADGSVALGEGVTASGINSIAIGNYSISSGTGSLAMLSGTAAGDDSIAIGYNSQTYQKNAIALGIGSKAYRTNDIAIGNSSSAAGSNAIAFGVNADASGSETIAIGSAKAYNNYAIAIGDSANAINSYSIALGSLARVTGNEGIAIGYNTKVSNASAVAIGSGATSSANNAWQLGSGTNSGANSLQFMTRKIVDYNASRTGQEYALAVLSGGTTGQVLKKKSNTDYDYEWGQGGSAETVYVDNNKTTSSICSTLNLGTYIIQLGSGAQVQGDYGIAFGYNSNISNQGQYSVAIGTAATSNALYGTAIGTNALVQKDNGIAIGQLATSNGVQSVVIGVGRVVDGNYSVGLLGSVTGTHSTAIGLGSVTGNHSIAVGEAVVVNDYAIGIGYNCINQSTRSVVIGYQNGYPDGFTADNVIAIGQNIGTVSTSSIAIGNQARAYGTYSVALGRQAKAEQSNSVQLGTGYNNTADTLQFMNCVVAENDTDLALDITSSIDNLTYVMTLNLVGKYSEYDSLTHEYSYKTKTISTTTIDLPLEEMVVNGSYNDNTQSIILTLKSGQTVTIPVGDLVSGLQTQSNILDALSLLPTNQTGLVTLTNGVASLDTTSYATVSALSGYQPLNSYLTSISALSNNQTGLIKLTNGVASLDTNNYATTSDLANYVTTSSLNTTLSSYVTTSDFNTTLGSYLTTTSAASLYQPLNTNLTSLSGLSDVSTGLVKMTNGVASLDTSLNGGTTGQVLTKDSNSDGDYSWQDPSGAGAYTFKNYISTNTLPVSPAKGDVWISDSASPLVFTIGGGGGGTLQAIDIGDTFAQGGYVYFDNTVSDADMLTFLQGLTYVDGTCDLVTCEDDQSQTKALVTAISMDVSEDPEDPQIIYALSCYTLTDNSVVWINDGSAMGMTTGWQTLTAEGGLLLDYSDGESQLEVTTLNTVATGWNGVIVFNMAGGSSITLTLNKGDWLTYNGSSWDKVDNQEYATTSYVDSIVGNISTILESLVTVTP